jgi:hypothetical protein
LISDEDDREFTLYMAKLFLQFGERFIIGRVTHIEGLEFEGGDHRLQCGKIALENDLTGLAILGIEEIDSDGRRGWLGHPMGGPTEESDTEKKNE